MIYRDEDTWERIVFGRQRQELYFVHTTFGMSLRPLEVGDGHSQMEPKRKIGAVVVMAMIVVQCVFISRDGTD